MFLILSILFPSFLASIFCISASKKNYHKIYSFGVLHHTVNIDKAIDDKKVIDMEATKATVAVANGLMDKKRFDDVVKIGGEAINAVGKAV